MLCEWVYRVMRQKAGSENAKSTFLQITDRIPITQIMLLHNFDEFNIFLQCG